jgi:hypothetical protein
MFGRISQGMAFPFSRNATPEALYASGLVLRGSEANGTYLRLKRRHCEELATWQSLSADGPSTV